MGFELDFDLEREDDIRCPACGRPIFSSGSEGNRVKMRCRCGKPLNIHANGGVVIVAVKLNETATA